MNQLYRSLVLGLLGACLILLARRQTVQVVAPKAAAPTSHALHLRNLHTALATPAVHRGYAPTLIDVSARMAPDQLVSLIHLNPGEQIATLDDHHSYVDVTVHGYLGDRRVLLLVH